VHYLGWKGEKVLIVHYLRRLGKCWVGTPHSHEGLKVGKGSWRVVCGLHKEGGGKWVCGGVGKANGQCELQDSMGHDELGDMGHYVPMIKRYTKSTIMNRSLSKDYLLFYDNPKLT